MAALFRATDWSKTSLGPLESWPEALRVAVGICLGSRFPMFVWWGPELVNLYNDAYVPVLGGRHPAAFGRPARPTWQDIWHVVGPQAEAVMRRGEATWNERVLLVMERHGYTEDTYFTWSYSPIFDGEGGIGGVFCACTEETPRVLAERERDRLLQQVEAERARLAEAFAQSPAFLAVLRGREHVFEFVNRRYDQLVGRRELLGRRVREALPEVAGQGYFEILDRVYASGEPFVGSAMRLMLQREPDGPLHEAYLDFVYQPMRGADGKVVGVLVHGVDVTQARAAADALRESEARFRQLADAMPQIVFAAQPDGTVDYFNRRWTEYTGLPQDATGFDAWRAVHTEEGLRRVKAAWPEAVRSGRPYEMEYPLRRHDGEYRWHLARALPIRDARGRIVRWFGTNTDIHDRKQTEDALAQALKAEQHARLEAEQASRMKDEFLATLGHELRSPLHSILGWSRIMRHGSASAQDVAHGAEVIERNARAQATIVDDLLDMSGIVSGKVRLELERVDLPLVVRSAVDAARPGAQAKHLGIGCTLDPLAGIELRGDANRLQQVLANLLSNAIKFTPAGGRIEVRLERAGSQVEISVSDTGEGIEAQFLPFVFDRFRQADPSTTRRHGGLGLGLSIVKQLVELHGGSVRARSGGPGQGTSFVVALPASPARHGGRRADAGQEAAPAAGAAIAGVRVLVVDDDGDARSVVKRVLENCSASAATAGSADEALELLRHERFDVLVSDIGMPDEDGYGLIRRVRALRSDLGALPAIALTAYSRPDDRERALRAGFQQHLPKPVEPAELVAMVARVARPSPG